jgi:hypothetical protein
MALNGTSGVSGWIKISDTAGEFTAAFDADEAFGSSVAGIGDLNNDRGGYRIGSYKDGAYSLSF